MSGSVLLVGGIGSGKTNYIARLWLAFKARRGTMRAEHLPSNIQYVDDAVRHLMALKFAPRSDRNIEDGRRDFVIEVRGDEGRGPKRSLTVPDITGELWKRAVETYELPQVWIDALAGSSSAILFVRAHSRYNVQPMDWVTARDLLKMHATVGEEDFLDDHGEEEDDDETGVGFATAEPQQSQRRAPPLASAEAVPPPDADMASSGEADPVGAVPAAPKLPSQVVFCELLRYLSLLLSDRLDGSKPRVAILVTAWDMLDERARAAGPMQYIQDQFPLLAGRIRSPGRLEFETFGMSIVGGDLRHDSAFRRSLQGCELSEVGYAAVMRDGTMVEDPDVTLPVAWALGA